MSLPPPDPVLDAYVANLIRDWPPLTDDQVSRIAVLLRPSPADHLARAA